MGARKTRLRKRQLRQWAIRQRNSRRKVKERARRAARVARKQAAATS
jgi:hypothetical protein